MLGHCGSGCWVQVVAVAAAVVAAVAEEVELVARAAEARRGVAAALIGSQGGEMRVSSAALDHVIGRCWQSEVSVKKKKKKHLG